jgi:hypothetical protein
MRRKLLLARIAIVAVPVLLITILILTGQVT